MQLTWNSQETVQDRIRRVRFALILAIETYFKGTFIKTVFINTKIYRPLELILKEPSKESMLL